jgi:GNAT superfamily N-acetyltransferase
MSCDPSPALPDPVPSVRLARPGDLDKLAAVERSAASVFAEVGLSWIAAGGTMEAGELAAACGRGSLWVAVDDHDRPVGFLAADQLDGWFHIAEVSVARSHQRQGIGAALVAAALAYARTAGFPAVSLTTYRDLPWNGPFYARLGFAEIPAAQIAPGHSEKLRAEAEAGHDPARRCVMAVSLR